MSHLLDHLSSSWSVERHPAVLSLIVYSPKHLISSVFCVLYFWARAVCLRVHFLLGISTTTNPSLPKYGDIDVLVNHLCLIIGLGGLLWLLTQLIQGEGQKALFTSLTKY